jgi:ABC-type antimicrobial peptide transport system permease subunit
MEAMRAELESMFSGEVTVSDPEPTLTETPGRMVSPSYFEAMGLHAAQGSLFTDEEAQKRSRVLVLGANLGSTLYEDGKAMGRQIIMNRQIYTIVGVLAPTGTELDGFGYTPLFRTAVFGRSSQTEVHFMVADPAALPEAEAQVTLWFTQKHGVVSVSAPREAAEQANGRNSRLAVIILFLAGSGFFIAAVNVSNILLSRTIRQFRSIGILKALGASKADIFRLYFLESGFLALGGMAAGIALTVLLSGFLATQLGSGALSELGIVLGVAASTIITMLITLYPSFQASKVPAAQAVKME